MGRINNRNTVIIHDVVMTFLAWQLAWWARFNFAFPFPEWQISLYTLPYVLFIQGAIYWRFNLYRGLWRFASLPDLWTILRAAMLGGLCITLVLFILFRLEGVPRSILILYPLFLVFLLGGPRLAYRLRKDHAFSLKTVSHSNLAFIIGAGRAGEMLAREMLREGSILPIGFVDDNPRLKNSEIHGIRVLGTIDGLNGLVKKYAPTIIVIAIPSASNEQMQRIAGYCEETGIPVRTLPNLADMISKHPSLDELRELSIEDLLGREKVELDWKLIHEGVVNQRVLVSGGGGSIGSELCRQIADLGPAQLIIYERSEFNLYKIQKQLLKSYSALKITGILGDVCDREKTEHTMQQCRPDIIFHAAAYKHVPILENQGCEAVRNNLFGTISIANAAEKCGCQKFVLISTDKAVNPVNVLGESKRVAELFCGNKNGSSRTRFITVRFGNVLGSDGSVVPLFQEQIKNGGPVTVTHPQVSRYFMTIREACQLILQAGIMGEGGEIFVLDMGSPVKIGYLAEQMIKLSGATPGNDIKIEYVGLRHGEKLSEELFHAVEQRENTSHDKILLARHPHINEEYLDQKLIELEHALSDFDEEKLRVLLKEVIQNIQLDNTIKDNIISLKK
ncbi:MAG: polysaccharide biosynthesis protein [Gammaproteobacteria bacterium]